MKSCLDDRFPIDRKRRSSLVHSLSMRGEHIFYQHIGDKRERLVDKQCVGERERERDEPH